MADEARTLLADYRMGRLTPVVPALLFVEILDVAGRRWRWGHGLLLQLLSDWEDLGFEVAEPDLPTVAAWVARGLTAYDAVYVSLAEKLGIGLLTSDREILEVAAEIAVPLSGL